MAKNKITIQLYIFFLIFFVFNSLLAQTEAKLIGFGNTNTQTPINTDRPTQTESAFIVPSRSFQIESGVIYINRQTNETSINNWLLGNTLLRYGVWDNFELRLGSFYERTSGYYKETAIDTAQQGMGPLMAGFKVHVVEEKGIRPQIAISADITLRHIGSLSYRPIFSYPTAKIAFSNTLSNKLSIGYNAGFGYNGSNADGFFIYSIVLGYQIVEKLSIFGEVYGKFDHGDLPNHRIDGGFTWLLKNNLQLDLSTGTGFDQDIKRFFISSGFSWRIPK